MDEAKALEIIQALADQIERHNIPGGTAMMLAGKFMRDPEHLPTDVDMLVHRSDQLLLASLKECQSKDLSDTDRRTLRNYANDVVRIGNACLRWLRELDKDASK